MFNTSPTTLLNPITIGDIHIDTPLMLAPMAGHTNYALRALCREQGGCGLVCTELISSNALQHKGSCKQSVRYFNWRKSEHPVAVQLFGNDPQVMAEAAQLIVEEGADIVDINMGCWVPKIAKKGGGVGLLRDINTATRVVETVVNAVDVPVTVKVRSGFEDGVVTAIPFAQAAEQVGVQAVAVHARFAQQGHAGEADWDVIRDVKQAVDKLVVIGNGDVHTGEDAKRMLETTGCDGVMIGRAALGQPWIFHHIETYLRTGEILPNPSHTERARLAWRHAQLTMESTVLHEKQAVLEMRGQLSKYKLDKEGSVEIRNSLVRVETLQDVEAILEPLIDR